MIQIFIDGCHLHNFLSYHVNPDDRLSTLYDYIFKYIIESSRPYPDDYYDHSFSFDLNGQGQHLRVDKTYNDYKIKQNYTIQYRFRFYGGGFVSNEADKNGYLKIFKERLHKYASKAEEEKLDTGYYFAQSGHHDLPEHYYPLHIEFGIDKSLDKDWIETVKKALNIIQEVTPGLRIKSDVYENDSLFKVRKPFYPVYITTNDDDSAFTVG